MKINLYPKKIILIFLVILFSIFSELNAKNFDKKNVICADETGPLFEFLIPQFNNKLIEKDFKLKIYDSIDRQKSSIGKATIKKKNSPIDRSYYFYFIKFSYDKDDFDEFFEFFPPSHLIMKNKQTLVCWEK